MAGTAHRGHSTARAGILLQTLGPHCLTLGAPEQGLQRQPLVDGPPKGISLVTGPQTARLVPPGHPRGHCTRGLLSNSPSHSSQQGHGSAERGPHVVWRRRFQELQVMEVRVPPAPLPARGLPPPHPCLPSPHQSENLRGAELEATHLTLLGTLRSQVES